MRRRGFLAIGSIVLVGLMSSVAALGGDTSLTAANGIRIRTSPFRVHVLMHGTRMESGWTPGAPDAMEVPESAEIEGVSTRSSFVASWPRVSGAIGYRLDVSMSAAFDSYVSGHRDLDVGNVTEHVVSELSPGTTLYYRVRAYDSIGTIIAGSDVMSVTTVATTGLIIHPTFDSSITGNANAAAIEAMIIRAISIYESLFRDPITVQILFRYARTMPDGTYIPSGFAATSLAMTDDIPWSTFINSLRADAKTPNDTYANASLPGAQLSSIIITKSANGRALALNTPPSMFPNGTIGNGGPYDGIVTLNSMAPFQFNRPITAYNLDAQLATEHEMDEVIGLGSVLGHNSGFLLPQDLFSWGSPGIRNVTSSGTRYFSINGGSNNIVTFNQDPQLDFGDWLSGSCPQAHPYVQNASGCQGQFSDIAAGSPEGVNLDVIGYDLVNPIVTTNASHITSFAATLNGTVNPTGQSASVHFLYGLTTSYGSITANQTYNGTTIQSVSANITGLISNRTYHFRLVGVYRGGVSYGSDRTFTTATGPPGAVTNPAAYLTSVSAILGSSVNPHGLSTTAHFLYGTTTNYGLTTASQTRTGDTDQSVNAVVAGLAASTTYHFRIVANNASGTTYGADRAFTTLSATGPPVVVSYAASSIGGASATLNGAVDPHGLTTSVRFQYGTTTSYGLTTASQTKTGNTFQSVTANITGLTAQTTYHFRIIATNSAGTSFGTDKTLTTLFGDQSVTWQNNPAHDGFNPASSLLTPLTLKWRRDWTGSGVTTISYPLIARGLVFVTFAGDPGTYGTKLAALDERTGSTVWWVNLSGTYSFSNAAYDAGKIFVVNFNGLLKSFDAASGAQVWSITLPGQYAFTSPPTAANGVVFVGGAGTGGTLYAVNETNGAVLWTEPVENGDHSSPAVSLGKVFVSYACPQAYAFNAATGQQLWHYSGSCEGGGGKTPVVHGGQLYVRDSYFTQTNGLVLNVSTGGVIRGFTAYAPPAFIGNLALFLQSGPLVGVNAQTGQVLWSFAVNGGLSSAPVVVNHTIYIGSNSGILYGLNTSGQQIWSTQVGAAIPGPDENNATLTTGLGSGDGLLVVPAGGIIAAYGN